MNERIINSNHSKGILFQSSKTIPTQATQHTTDFHITFAFTNIFLVAYFINLNLRKETISKSSWGLDFWPEISFLFSFLFYYCCVFFFPLQFYFIYFISIYFTIFF